MLHAPDAVIFVNVGAVFFPLYRSGTGAVKGLSPAEHVCSVGVCRTVFLPIIFHQTRKLSFALAWELESTPLLRLTRSDRRRLEIWTQKGSRALPLAPRIRSEVPRGVLRPLAEKLHLPFTEWVLETTGHPDPDLLRCSMCGFEYISGTLSLCRVGVSHDGNPQRPSLD